MNKTRKIFFVVASGGHETDKHYYDTIERKRTVEEAQRFLEEKDVEILKEKYHSGPFAVWGAVPGPGNSRTWDSMEPGDYVLIYKSGEIIFAAEVALKTRNPRMAEYLWGKDGEGKTWEYMYFLVNTQKVKVNMAKFNPYLGYAEKYFPRGFMSIDQEKANNLLNTYGDLLSALQKIQEGKELEKISEDKKKEEVFVDEQVERATTEHDEMQWRLIRLGKRANVDVWIPRNDQGKEYEGNRFKGYVLDNFQETLDVPLYVKNIDVVWKYGFSIKSAFEIENSTSVYSGILRLSDLRALAPNSNYPLFIVADRDRKNKVFNELKRPTFDNPYLKLSEVISFLSYDAVRELDEKARDIASDFSLEFIASQGEKIS
jgi:hypothetical protein